VCFKKRGHRIFDDDDVVAAISRVPCGGFDAHVRGHSRDHQRIQLQVSQELIDACPIEGAAGVFVDHQLVIERLQLVDDVMFATAFGPERGSGRLLKRIGIPLPASRDHVATIRQQRAVPREDDFPLQLAKRFEQPLSTGDRFADSRNVVLRYGRVLLDEHLRDAAIRVRAVILIVNNQQSGSRPVDIKCRPRHDPIG
jgi:hypothetical protein